MRALVTGGYGFVGQYLVEHLVKCGDDVAVTYNPATCANQEGVLPLPKSVQHFALDVTNKKAVENLVSITRPDAFYHLAALTFVPDGEKNFDKVFETNFSGTLNVLDAICDHSKETKLLYVSSSEVYGEPKTGSLPLTEQAELRPVTGYGLSKACAELSVFRYVASKNLSAVRVRPFPHTGPGQMPHFAVSSFAKQLASIKLGKSPNLIQVGNLSAKRDYSDVSDIVRGYREVLLNGKSGEVYNLCSGKSVEIKEVLDMLIKISGIEVEVQVDPERVRSVDVAEDYGTYQKANKELGWKPRIELEDTLRSLFNYWLEKN